MARTACRPRNLLILLMALTLALGSGPPKSLAAPAPQAQIYRYDFEGGADGWNLQSGIWSRVFSDGGYTLRGEGHGFARLMEHSGTVSSLRFRFRLLDMQSELHANVLESFPPHTRYFVSFGINGVTINRQQGASFQNLGQGFVSIGPNTFYDVQILVGRGSIDVFLDGEGAVGVDDPSPPPPGYVSFESLDNSIVDVDNVEVESVAEPAPHPRAPLPPLSLPPGPNVGPFVNGTYAGDVSLTGNQSLALSQGRYTIREGNINLNGNARLRIEPGAVLVFDKGSSPLAHWGINMQDAAVFELDGGNVIPEGGGLVRIHAFGAASVTISNAKPWIHYINAGEDATVSVVNSHLVTSIGGQVMLVGRASASMEDSEISSINLVVPAGAIFEATGLRSGTTFSDFDLQRDNRALSGIGFNLRMRNVRLTADTLGEGPYERGWIIFADETATTRITDSTLHKLVLQMPPSGPDFAVGGLRLGQPTSRTLGGSILSNVTVTGQWGFFIHGSRRATFDNIEGLWFFLYDRADVLVRNSTMNEFDPRNYTGTLTFENSSWNTAGEIIEGNDFLMAGTLNINVPLEGLSWSQSTVTRRFPIQVRSPAGDVVPGATVTLTRGSEVVRATTDALGEASVDLRFTDQNYTQPWQLTTSVGLPPVSADFFTSTPIVLGPTTALVSVTQALASIEGMYGMVVSYNASDTEDPWKIFDPSAPSFANDLMSFETGRAYWIKLAQGAVLSYGSRSYHLAEGWNLVGWRG